LIKKTVRLLKNNKARRMTKMVDATTGYGTSPLNASYIGIVHPNTTYDLKGITNFLPVEKYASTAGIMEGEVGKYDEVRFVETTNAKVFEGEGAGTPAIDVYSTIVFGSDAYGTTRISGEAMKNIVKPLGAGEDPLNQRATSGWKATFVAKILNQAYLVRIEHAVSA